MTSTPSSPPDPTPIGATKAARLQRLDGIVGPPICLFLTLLAFLKKPAAPGSGSPKSIAFIKLGEQGSTVLAIPAIEEAVARVGRKNTFFVVFSENRKILDLLDLIPAENVIEIRTSSLGSFFASVWAATLKLRSLPLDAAIDLDFFARSSAILTWLSGARWRVGLHSYFGEGPYRGNLMTHRPRYNPHLHTSRFFYSLVKALDQPSGQFPAWLDAGPQPAPKVFPADPESLSRIKSKFPAKWDKNSLPPILLLNANCSDMIPLRRWAPERFVELARRFLAARPEAAVIFTGTAVESEQAESLAASVGSQNCFSLAGKTSLSELFALYSLSQMLVTNDSGPAHFASLTPIKIITLFGPETPALFGPISQNAVSLSAGLPCSPCVSAQNNRLSACKNNLCMQAIGVDRVFSTVEKQLLAAT